MTFKISRFRSERDNTPETVAIDWPGLCELLKTPRYTPCAPCRPEKGTSCPYKSGPCWSPATFNGKRSKANALEMHFLCYDLDHVTRVEFTALLKRLVSSGYAFAVHSTHSNAPLYDDLAFRLVLPLTAPLPAVQAQAVRTRFEEHLSLPSSDVSTRENARIYFLPSCPEGQDYVFESVAGQPVDPGEVLGLGPKFPFQAPAPVTVAALVPETEVEVDLTGFRDLSHLSQRHREAVKNALKGDLKAQVGGRDNALQALATAAATVAPELPTEAFIELFRVAIENLVPDPAGLPWIEVFREKMDRALFNRRAALANMKAVQDALSKLHTNESKRLRESDNPAEDPSELEDKYSAGEIERWAQEQNTTPEGFDLRWLIQRGQAYWVFIEGKYRAPISAEELRVSLPRDLARAPIDLYKRDKEGKPISFSVPDILAKHCTVARNVVVDLSLQNSYYDATTQTFYEATCPLRPLIPTYSEDVAAFLELLVGDGDREHLLDWVSAVPQLNLQCAALYLDGFAGVGKTLLAHGLARLWSTTPTNIDDVLANFNDSLTKNPFVFADEGLPKRDKIVDELRRMIGSPSRALNRKFMPTAEMQGNLRLMISANNARVIESRAQLSISDIEALSERILYLKVTERPKQWFRMWKIRGEDVYKSLCLGDAIAQHALWLAKTRKIANPGRFLVSGYSTEFHQQLATNNGPTGLVFEFLARFLSQKLAPTDRRCLYGNGELLVNTELVCDPVKWDQFVPSNRIPSASVLARSLRQVSDGAREVEGLTYHVVNNKLFLGWLAREQVGELGVARERIGC